MDQYDLSSQFGVADSDQVVIQKLRELVLEAKTSILLAGEASRVHDLFDELVWASSEDKEINVFHVSVGEEATTAAQGKFLGIPCLDLQRPSMRDDLDMWGLALRADPDIIFGRDLDIEIDLPRAAVGARTGHAMVIDLQLDEPELGQLFTTAVNSTEWWALHAFQILVTCTADGFSVKVIDAAFNHAGAVR